MGFIDRLFLEKESGMLSIGRQFQYDEVSEVCNKVAREMFLFEKAFELILKRNSECEVLSWHDMLSKQLVLLSKKLLVNMCGRSI